MGTTIHKRTQVLSSKGLARAKVALLAFAFFISLLVIVAGSTTAIPKSIFYFLGMAIFICLMGVYYLNGIKKHCLWITEHDNDEKTS